MEKSKRSARRHSHVHPWRVNYVVNYQNKASASAFRTPILAILQGIAFVQGIDCAISFDHAFPDEKHLAENSDWKDVVSDLVYFQSAARTKIRAADLRKMIDLIFQFEGAFLGPLGIDIFPQMQKSLYMYPYPAK